MRTYTSTEETRNAMLKELELEKFKTPDQFAQTEVERKALNWCAAYLRAVGKWEPTV